MTTVETILLYGFGLLAGAMDAMVGAGGLIQIPALLIVVSEAEVAAVLGTHKFASTIGTAAAVCQYHRAGRLSRHASLPMVVVPAMFGAFLGARAVSSIPGEYVRPALLVFLAAAALYLLRKNNLREPDVSNEGLVRRRPWLGAGLGLALGFYDGAIGLGAGSLFLLALVTVWGLDFLSAAAAARVINLATNLTATAAFCSSGNILYAIAIPLALMNVLGAVVGVRLATTKGHGFIKTVLLLTVAALILKLACDVFRPWLSRL